MIGKSFSRDLERAAGLRLAVLALMFWLSVGASSARAATVSGTVTTPDGEPAVDTRVVLVESNRSEFVDEAGGFLFADVADGHYHIQAVSRRYGSSVVEIDIDGADVRLDIRLSRAQHIERIVVTAGAGRGVAEVYQPVSVLDSDELTAALEPTLGETLDGLPGVRSTYFGPGASRPIIRGQGGGRIRVLEGGLDVGDASSTSPDHAVAVDPIGAESIEILRGPATLLYGSTAVGGVVNVLDRRIPDHVPQEPFGGSFQARLGSAADERSGALALNGGGGSFAWHLSAFDRQTSDVDIPGNAVVDDPESPSQTLPNSASESDGATFGGSWVGQNGYVGIAARRYTTLYGIPAELEEEEEDVRGVPLDEEGVRIDMESWRYELRGDFNVPLGPFSGLRFGLARIDYDHAELEGAEVGTRFSNDDFEGRFELRHGTTHARRGIVGLQIGRRDLEAVGAEAFLPPAQTESGALFVLQEFERGPMLYEFGGRYEDQRNRADGQPTRDFDGISASFGTVWRIDEAWSLGASLARAVRLPGAEELYSDGPHVATFSYERGDVDLSEETSLGLDVGLRRRAGRLTGELNLFVNRYDDYIFESPTGEIEDGLPVFEFMQGDAEFRGFELAAQVELFEAGAGHVGLELLADYVRAELSAPDRPVPRIPPLRTGIALHYESDRWRARAGATRYADQDRLAPVETATDGYTLVEASLAYRLLTTGLVHEFSLRGSNLTDELARNHASRLKDRVPLPGRDLSLVYRLLF